jgi:Zn-dependent protease
MNASWLLGRLSGIDVRVHWTFLLLPVWVFCSSLAAGSGTVAATVTVGFVFAIFGCVVLHELGHSLMARQFGIPTRNITLLPIGGVATLQRMPRNPWQELAIAIAGPAVNIMIAALILAGLAVLATTDPTLGTLVTFLTQLAWVNIALVVFNMLPAFPMDGGRVLRAGLALVLPYTTATKLAAAVGQLAATGLALLGLMTGNLMLVFVSGFVFLAARGEAMMADRESIRSRNCPNQIDAPDRISSMPGSPDDRSLPIVSSQWNARSALGWLSDDSIDEVLVSNHGSVVGVVRKRDLRAAVLTGRGAWAIDRLLAMRLVPMRG